jgi:N-methylhydantoinase A
VYDRDRLPTGATLAGPAVVEGGESTVVVGPEDAVRVDDYGTLRVEVGA